jgi:hypothetical protein
MNNIVFGKTMENIRKRVNVELVHTKCKRSKLVDKSNYKERRIFSNGLVAIRTHITNLVLDKPIYCGFTILDNIRC